MKKLMIAAAAAAMFGGVYADWCDDDPEAQPECSVYNLKIKVKTLAPKALTIKQDCDDDDCVAYYKNATRTFDGLVWLCDATCEDWEDGYDIVMWEKATKSPVLGLLAKGTNENEKVTFDVLSRFDKKANKVQAATTFELEVGDITVAGFGTFDVKKNNIKSISGNAAGTLEPADSVEKGCNECTAYVIGLCEEFDGYEYATETTTEVAASGTWSLKYNKSLSTGSKRASQVVPSYAQAEE